jgi:hypothetical protein
MITDDNFEEFHCERSKLEKVRNPFRVELWNCYIPYRNYTSALFRIEIFFTLMVNLTHGSELRVLLHHFFTTSLQVAIRAVADRHGISGRPIKRLGGEVGDRVVELAHHAALFKLEILREGVHLRRRGHRAGRRRRTTSATAAALVLLRRRHAATIILARRGAHRGVQRIVEGSLHLAEHTTLLVVKIIGEFLEGIRDLRIHGITMVGVLVHSSTALHSTLIIGEVVLLKRVGSGTHGNRGTDQRLAKHLVSESWGSYYFYFDISESPKKDKPW